MEDLKEKTEITAGQLVIGPDEMQRQQCRVHPEGRMWRHDPACPWFCVVCHPPDTVARVELR